MRNDDLLRRMMFLLRKNDNRKISALAEIHLYFAVGELSFGKADYHSAFGGSSFTRSVTERKQIKMNFSIFSPCDGEIVSLSLVPDEAFSSGMLGEGFAVIPENDTVFSPVNGVIESVSDSKHAYAISSEIGDILVHIGIDTVKVPEAFEPIVKVGDRVAAGQPIARADLKMIRDAELPTVIPVLITDKKVAGEIKINYGKVCGGRDKGLVITE